MILLSVYFVAGIYCTWERSKKVSFTISLSPSLIPRPFVGLGMRLLESVTICTTVMLSPSTVSHLYLSPQEKSKECTMFDVLLLY